MRSAWMVPTSAMTLVALLLSPATMHAQGTPGDSAPAIDLGSDSSTALSRFQRRLSGQLDAVQMRPLGELARNIGFGYGVNAAGLMSVDDAGIVAVRAELGIAQYGSEHATVPLSPTVGRILVDVTTSNDVFTGALGAQVMAPSGGIRPYVTGSAGFVMFVTESNATGNSDSQPFASTTNHADAGFAWLAGGGVYIPIYRGRQLISVNVGATYHATQGRQSYLKPGSIHDLPGGGIAIDPMYSEARFVTWRLGVRIGG